MKNIEDKSKINEESKDDQLGAKSIGYTVKEELSQEVKNMLDKLSNEEKLIDYRKLYFKGGNNNDYDFSNFRPLRERFRAIYYGDILIPGAEREQDDFDDMLDELKKYNPRNSEYRNGKENLLINAKKIYDGREMIINAFKDKILPLDNPDDFPEYVFPEDLSPKSKSSSHTEDISLRDMPDLETEESVERRRKGQESDKLNEMITKKDKTINKDLLTE